MSGTPERVLLEVRETRRSAGLVRGLLAPLACVALMVGLPWLELRFLGLDPRLEVAAGVGLGAFLLLLWWLSFLGRQHVTVSNERVLVESGFWNKLRDDVEVFRIRDVVVSRNLWQRLLGVGDVTVKANEGRGMVEEVHVLRGMADPIALSEVIRGAWKAVGQPRNTTNLDG